MYYLLLRATATYSADLVAILKLEDLPNTFLKVFYADIY